MNESQTQESQNAGEPRKPAIGEEGYLEALEKDRTLKLLKLTGTGDVKTYSEALDRIFNYVTFMQENYGAVRLSSINRIFHRLGKKFDTSVKDIVAELTANRKLYVDAHPETRAMIVLPEQFRVMFHEMHTEMETPAREKSRIWHDILRQAK